MTEVVTISQRKARETARRRAAAVTVMAELRIFAARHGGRFTIFGSVAEGRMSFDSDFDVIVDFPIEHEIAAVEFVEDLCRREKLPHDIHLGSLASRRFLDRIAEHAVTLS